MAQAIVMNGVTAVVDLAGATAFSPTSAFCVDAVGLGVNEYVIVNKRMSDGITYKPLTNSNGSVVLSAIPNTVIVDAPGTYKITKPTSTSAVTVGWELI
jgi:hypothetical protein